MKPPANLPKLFSNRNIRHQQRPWSPPHLGIANGQKARMAIEAGLEIERRWSLEKIWDDVTSTAASDVGLASFGSGSGKLVKAKARLDFARANIEVSSLVSRLGALMCSPASLCETLLRCLRRRLRGAPSCVLQPTYPPRPDSKPSYLR